MCVFVCVLLSLCLAVMMTSILPFLSGVLLERGADVACPCETDLSQENWEHRAEYQRRTETSLVTHNISIRRYLDA